MPKQNDPMKSTRPLLIAAALAISFCSCKSSPPFNIRLVDSASGAPIGGAEVDRYTDSGRWTTSRESNTHLGETDERGMFGVDEIDMDSVHRITFYKAGYLAMFVFVRNLDEEDVCWISSRLELTSRAERRRNTTIRISSPQTW